MKVCTLSLPPLQTNCYIVYHKEGGKCIIIDPASRENEISKKITELKLTPSLIYLTHGHFDHIGAADALRERFKVPLAIHEKDADALSDGLLNASRFLIFKDFTVKPADILLKEGDEIELEGDTFKILSTSGHTKGSSVLLGNGVIFSGDTLFKGGYGRYDLLGGSEAELFHSLKRILDLDESLIVYPGHGETTTIKREKEQLAF